MHRRQFFYLIGGLFFLGGTNRYFFEVSPVCVDGDLLYVPLPNIPRYTLSVEYAPQDGIIYFHDNPALATLSPIIEVYSRPLFLRMKVLKGDASAIKVGIWTDTPLPRQALV